MTNEGIFPPDVMERERLKSLEELKKLGMMVNNWKNSYLRQVNERWKPGEIGEEWDFVCKELLAEVEDVMYPYIQRMKDCKYLTVKETQGFMAEAYVSAEALKEEIAALCEQKQKEYDAKQAEEVENDPKKLKVELDEMKSKYEQLMERLEALEK